MWRRNRSPSPVEVEAPQSSPRTRSDVVPALSQSGSLPRLWDLDDVTEVTETTGLITAQPRSAARAGFTIMTGIGAGRVVSFGSKAQMLVGRSRGADLQLDATGVSRMHFRVIRRDDGHWLEDLGSTNGTIVNGAPIRGAVKLAVGDRVQLGPDTVLQFGHFDQTEETLAKKLFEASTRDVLTGVFNRRYFHERLEAEAAFARRHESPLSLVLIDLDLFKAVNQLHGTEGGDIVLRAVANAIRETTRSEELLCRFGGEEFALLVREPLDAAARIAERMRASIDALRIAVGKKSVRITVSIGVAEIGDKGAQVSTDGLVRVADKRLAHAKELGRNRVAVL